MTDELQRNTELKDDEEIELKNANENSQQLTPLTAISKSNESDDGTVKSGLPSYARYCKFEWSDINVYGGKNKEILYDMNGSISSGVFTAIMGGSGAGKSTLLNVLSGRANLNELRVTGTLSINNKQFKCTDQSIIKSLCSFVAQSDILCPTQTVKEALLFYAKLKLSNRTKEKRIKRVKYLIKVLHLEECQNRIIGDNAKKKGISGGERRRVSIAAGIINDVDIIFIDEPTSGLDAYTASEIVKTLKQFCTDSNKTIISVIHQPSVHTFYLFDKLILLSHGKCCFNSCLEDIDRFFKNSLKPRTNPADVIIYETQQKPEIYALEWSESQLNTDIKTPINHRQLEEFTILDLKDSQHNNLQTASWMVQLPLLLKRELQSLYRDKRLTFMRMAQVLFFAVCCGVIFFEIKRSFQERVKCFFLLTIIALLFGMVSLLVVFPKQRVLFEREYNSNTYSIICFAFSFIIIEIPRETVHMLIFTLISYSMIELDGNWILYWFCLFLCSFSGGSFGMIFGVICKTSIEAAQMVPAALIPILMFCDAIVSIYSLPIWLGWIAYLDPLYYLLRCLMIIEFFGQIYPRTLSEEDQYICDHWSNITFPLVPGNDSKTTKPPKTTTLPPTMRPTTDKTMYFSTTELNGPNLMGDFANNISIITTLSEAQEIAKDYCMTEIPAQYFFAAKNMNPNDFFPYCIIIVVIAISLRIIAISMLYSKTHNGMSWLRNFIKTRFIKCCCCCCYGNKLKHKIKDQRSTKRKRSRDANLSVSFGLDLSEENEPMARFESSNLL